MRYLFIILCACGHADSLVPEHTTLSGGVWLTRLPLDNDSKITAQFGGALPANIEHEQAFGTCYLAPYAPEWANMTYASAGDLEIVGALTPWQVAPGPNLAYASARAAEQWSEGTALQVRATGAEVPAFAATVVAPPTLQILNDRAALTAAIDVDADLTLQWVPTTASQVWIAVAAGDQQVACSWPGVAGSGTIPGEALAGLPRAGRAIRSPVALNKQNLHIGRWSIGVYAQARSQLPDGGSL